MSESVYPHPIIAREGWPFLAIAILIALALTWISGLDYARSAPQLLRRRAVASP